jgi:hypothetical protein
VGQNVILGVGRSLIAALIWIPYFLFSRRVKNTFVRGKQEQRSG